ncbi:ArnT family glycosyltransferase [Robertkochia sediminum]|uniref:ArnT family glycosyltransferase n=1 Tax=Robertkochia sediminum TaxID=2785326 RepID=UPI0019342D42|nr:glycosyltransferase family 39 protein [Robertkochia sediminum]MBL7473840.1 glycosyltransferase family 39 protein [Robertkochia sediminum]
MRTFRKSKNTLLILILVITGANLLQIIFTELLMDEAYYVYFSRELSWGYFDHPPMVAFLIHLGSSILPAEAGVRLFSPFIYALSLILLWDLVDHPLKGKHPWLFFWFTGSLALLSAFGFFMLPDTPLILFGILLVWVYKRHLNNPDLLTMVGMGLCMAAMMYSKYQGALFITFLLLSRPQNFKDGKIWGAIILALILYLPHLWWLYDNDLVSLRYHLVERANSAYHPRFTLHYLLNMIALGGLAFPLVYFAVVKAPVKNAVDRGLKTVFYGFILFFLISSFNRKTQIQWVNLVHIPLVLFTYRYALNHLHFRKWLYRLSAATVVLLTFLRLAMVFPQLSPVPLETHGNKEWTRELYEKTGGLPVVFHNSYRDAATYAFYTGARVFSLNDVGYRQNQFDIDHSETPLRNKPVVLLSQDPVSNASITYTRPFKHKEWYGMVIDSFVNYSKLQFNLDNREFATGIPDEFTAQLHNPYPETIPLRKLRIEGITYDDNRKIIDTFVLKTGDPEIVLPPGKSAELRFSLPGKKKPIKASYFHIGLGHYDFKPGFEGNMVNINPVERDP